MIILFVLFISTKKIGIKILQFGFCLYPGFIRNVKNLHKFKEFICYRSVI